MLAIRRRHGDQHHGRLLPLRFVHRPNAGADRERRTQQIHLHVARSDHEDIVEANRLRLAALIHPALPDQRAIYLIQPLGFLDALLRVVLVLHGHEPQPSRRERAAGVARENQLLLRRGLVRL